MSGRLRKCGFACWCCRCSHPQTSSRNPHASLRHRPVIRIGHAAAGHGAGAGAVVKTAASAEARGAQAHAVSASAPPRGQTRRRPESTAAASARRTSARPGARPTMASQTSSHGEELNARPVDAARRGAGSRTRADRDPALRRRQSQPVFSARLQSRPRHRPGDLRRRRAGQHAHPCAWPGLCRSELADAGDGQFARRAQGPVFRRRRRFRLGRQSAHRPDRQRAEGDRAADRRQLRLSAHLRHGLREGGRRHAAGRRRVGDL